MKYLLAFIGAVVIAGAIYGGYQYPQIPQLAGSAVNTTFNSAKVATIDMSPATNSATSTSIKNTDGSTRFVESLNADCTGVGTSYTNLTGTGLASWTITAATTTVANQGSQGNANTFTGTVATTTAFSLLSSVISSTGTAVSYSWPSGTYLTFTFNATNTAACIVGVNYLAS